MKLVAMVIALLFLDGSLSGQHCHCKKATDDDTRWGGNEYVSFREKQTYRQLRGFVHAFTNDNTLANVLVEVYTYSPSLLAQGYQPPNLRGRRIAACITGDDGGFSFNGIPAGRYELRTSLSHEWNVSHIYVVINPRNRKGSWRQISVEMKLGT